MWGEYISAKLVEKIYHFKITNLTWFILSGIQQNLMQSLSKFSYVLFLDNSISPLFLAVTYQLQSRLCTEHSRVAAMSLHALGFNFDITEHTMSGRVEREKRKAIQWPKHTWFIVLGKGNMTKHYYEDMIMCLFNNPERKTWPSITTKDMVMWLIVLKEKHDQALLRRTWSCD